MEQQRIGAIIKTLVDDFGNLVVSEKENLDTQYVIKAAQELETEYADNIADKLKKNFLLQFGITDEMALYDSDFDEHVYEVIDFCVSTIETYASNILILGTTLSANGDVDISVSLNKPKFSEMLTKIENKLDEL